MKSEPIHFVSRVVRQICQKSWNGAIVLVCMHQMSSLNLCHRLFGTIIALVEAASLGASVYAAPPPFLRNDTFSTATFSLPSASLRSWYTYSTNTSP